MDIDFSVHLPTNPMERRRLQNRIAQRKYRQKRDQRPSGSNNAAVDDPDVGQTPVAPPPEYTAAPNASGTTDLSDHVHLFTHNDFNTNIDDELALLLPNSGTNEQSLGHVVLGSRPTLSSIADESPTMNATPSTLIWGDSTTALSLEQSIIKDNGGSKSNTPWLDDLLQPAPHSNAKRPDDGYLSPLHMAARKGNDRIIKALMQHNVDVNEKDSEGRTALIHASMGNHISTANMLLAHGARINEVDNENRSCLHWAVLHRYQDVLEVLLDHYSRNKAAIAMDINAYDDAGWTPLHMAIDRDFEPGVHLLLQHGANAQAIARKCPYAAKAVPGPPSRPV